MTASSSPFVIANVSVHDRLRQFLSSGRLLEIVYRDSAGQICTVHDVIRDQFSRAGQEFVLLGRGNMIGIDHVVTIDGERLPVSQY
ncbi:hypothetical protein BKP64_01585 [Marinobacter salinus]|uniref:Rho-binding antiterminator n=1 Tax=Marinobacter salinus TaxID=1874317 RepID=A0A1D9GH89_9GAMM|nr:hypothetical protein [Marinobacter salinus]AOY86973.1 hypothetical protein BKP64_01585 [Marinobacter salinus]